MRTLARLVLAAALASMLLEKPALSAPRARPNSGLDAGSALGEISAEIARSAFGLAPGAAVIALLPAPGSPSLGPGVAVRLAVRVALALGPNVAAWPYAESDSHARALPHAARPLVLLTPRLEGDRIAVGAEVVGPATTSDNGATLGRFVARRALDAEVRSFLPALRLQPSELKPLAGTDADVLALACGEPNHDGPPLLATLSRARVTLGTMSGTRYELVKTKRLAELAPVAPAPLREPLASVTFGANGDLLLGVSDRAHAVRLTAAFATWTALTGLRLPWPGGGCARLEELFVSARVERCAADETPLQAPAASEPLDAIAGANVTARNGTRRLVRAGRRASDGSIVLLDGEREARLEHAGAQLAVGDLDGDGAPELVTSLDTADPLADAVVVYSWLGTGLKEAFRSGIPTGVRALAVCPQRVNGIAPVAVATNNGVWVIR
jgi:hypothetical protein